MSEEIGETIEASGEVETTETVEASEPEISETVEETVEEPEVVEETPEFSFDGWDGAFESLPDTYQPVYTNIHNRVQSEIESLRNSLTADRELYQALLDGEDIGQQAREELAAAKKELEKFQGGQTDWEKQKSEYESQIAEYISQAEEREKAEHAEANRWAQEFETKHRDLLGVPESREKFLQFLNGGFTPEISISLAKETNEDVINSTVSYAAQGVPEHYALRMARADHGRPETEAAKPRASAQITAGATASTNVPDSAEKGVSDKTFNIQDARKLAVSRAFKRRTG